MPARDLFHNCVKNALVKDGWTITHDPFVLRWGRKDSYVDLGARTLLAAEKNTQRIALIVNRMRDEPELDDVDRAIGQYTLYTAVLQRLEPERELYLVAAKKTADTASTEQADQLLVKLGLRLAILDSKQEVFLQWKK